MHCRRYAIDNSQRELHGALLDAEILAEVYLAMTGGKRICCWTGATVRGRSGDSGIRRLPARYTALKVVYAGREELEMHAACLGNN